MGRRAATWVFVTQCFSARNPYPAPGPDLDECRVRNLCQHACRNTEGSYQCLCPAGYRLLPSGKNCQGEQEGASLTQSALSSPLSTISCDGGEGGGTCCPPPPRWPEPEQHPQSQRELRNCCGQALNIAGRVSLDNSLHLSVYWPPGEVGLTRPLQ